VIASSVATDNPSAARQDAAPPPAIHLEGVCKRFPGVVALDNVSLQIRRGEVHALLGENGAGKSTLIKVLTGSYQPDSGRIVIAGHDIRVTDARQARKYGVSVVPQDIMAIPDMPIGRSILLGREGVITTRSTLSEGDRRLAKAALDRVNADFGPDIAARELSVPQLRLAQLARALADECAVLILDEPTAALNEHDADVLLARVETARSDGTAVLYVTHRLSEVMRIADRVTVLRDGAVVGSFDKHGIEREAIIELLTKGEALAEDSRSTRDEADNPPGRVVLRAKDIHDKHRLHGVSLDVRAGQIVGLAGVQGSGHGQMAKVLGGLITASGTLEIDGRRHRIDGRATTFHRGVVVVPGDRRNAGIVGSLSIKDNIGLSSRIRPNARRLGLRWPRRERDMAREHIQRLSIRPRNINARVGQLSGGNQQKVAIARALEGKPRVLVVEEPTQGIDINAKAEVRALLQRFARDGGAVVVATSEFEELIGLADCTYVMCAGRVTGTLTAEQITYRNILRHAIG
jgi:ABC-type sugar transport system ATPase subunit